MLLDALQHAVLLAEVHALALPRPRPVAHHHRHAHPPLPFPLPLPGGRGARVVPHEGRLLQLVPELVGNLHNKIHICLYKVNTFQFLH